MQKRVMISGLLLVVVLIQAAYATEPIFADPSFTDINVNGKINPSKMGRKIPQ